MKKLSLILLLGIALAGCSKHEDQARTAKAPSHASSTAASIIPQSQVKAKTYEGPFGLASSIPIEELEQMGFKKISGRPDAFFFGTPPKPLQDAEEYAVVATPVAGSCRIIAHIDVPVVNGSGDQLKAKTDQIAEMMALKYGKYSDKVDYIKQGAYRDNPEFWMLGLKEESIYYAYDWTAQKTSKPLPAELENIEVAADAIRISSGYVTIKYTFKNFDACHKEIEAKKSNNL